MHVSCTWLECEELVQMEIAQMETAMFYKYLVDKTFPRDTRKTFCFAKLSFLIHTFCAYTIYTHITHRCWGVLQRENPRHKPWQLEIVIPTYLYTFACGFPSTPTSPFPYHWEVDSSNTYHTLSECQVRIWYCWRVRDYHTHLSLHICLWISSTPTSPFPYHWEVDSPNTYHTVLECSVRFWCCWEKLKEAKDGRCNMELVAGSRELDKTRFWETLLE